MKKSTRRTTSNRHQSNRPRQSRHLRRLLADIFNAAFDPDICGFATTNDLAVHAGLAWDTVDSLYQNYTYEPRYSTIRKLAIAVKMDLQLFDEEVEVISSLKMR